MWRKITSLVMLWSALALIYTGIMLYIAPSGRVANWAGWSLFGLNKGEYEDLHTTFMVLFMVGMGMHLYYNWRPITLYLKNQARELVVLTKEMVIATLLSVAFVVGTLFSIPPFIQIVEFGKWSSEYWITIYGEPPFGHAELSALQQFTKRTGLNFQTSVKALRDAGIAFDEKENLEKIARNNRVTPQALYNIMLKADED